MSESPRRCVYLHSEDLDGWLAPHNHSLLPLYGHALARLEGLSAEADGVRHEVRIVLNSGKAPGYLEAQAALFGGRWVIGCNGAAWREQGGETRRVAPPAPDFDRLRSLLALPPSDTGVVPARLDRHAAELVIEEGKRDEHGDLVLTLFPEPDPVAHRWRFRGGLDRVDLYEGVRRLIREHGLSLHAYPYHGDGGLDVVPLWDGRPLGKWTLPRVAAQIFPGAGFRLTHGGDAHTDLPAMEEEGVLPLTAENCQDVVEVVRRRGGVVAERAAPEGGAALECYAALAGRGFYGPLSAAVGEICREFLPSWE